MWWEGRWSDGSSKLEVKYRVCHCSEIYTWYFWTLKQVKFTKTGRKHRFQSDVWFQCPRSHIYFSKKKKLSKLGLILSPICESGKYNKSIGIHTTCVGIKSLHPPVRTQPLTSPSPTHIHPMLVKCKTNGTFLSLPLTSVNLLSDVHKGSQPCPHGKVLFFVKDTQIG